jgi:hypothetical protein
MNIDPSQFLRQFHLGHANIGMGSSTEYSLVFTRAGGMFVRAVTDYGDDSAPPVVHEFRLADFPLLTINGRPMAEVVSEKLDDILPQGKITSSTFGTNSAKTSTATR